MQRQASGQSQHNQVPFLATQPGPGSDFLERAATTLALSMPPIDRTNADAGRLYDNFGVIVVARGRLSGRGRHGACVQMVH